MKKIMTLATLTLTLAACTSHKVARIPQSEGEPTPTLRDFVFDERLQLICTKEGLLSEYQKLIKDQVVKRTTRFKRETKIIFVPQVNDPLCWSLSGSNCDLISERSVTFGTAHCKGEKQMESQMEKISPFYTLNGVPDDAQKNCSWTGYAFSEKNGKSPEEYANEVCEVTSQCQDYIKSYQDYSEEAMRILGNGPTGHGTGYWSGPQAPAWVQEMSQKYSNVIKRKPKTWDGRGYSLENFFAWTVNRYNRPERKWEKICGGDKPFQTQEDALKYLEDALSLRDSNRY